MKRLGKAVTSLEILALSVFHGVGEDLELINLTSCRGSGGGRERGGRK
jgi:hypothetical protein